MLTANTVLMAALIHSINNCAVLAIGVGYIGLLTASIAAFGIKSIDNAC